MAEEEQKIPVVNEYYYHKPTNSYSNLSCMKQQRKCQTGRKSEKKRISVVCTEMRLNMRKKDKLRKRVVRKKKHKSLNGEKIFLSARAKTLEF